MHLNQVSSSSKEGNDTSRARQESHAFYQKNGSEKKGKNRLKNENQNENENEKELSSGLQYEDHYHEESHYQPKRSTELSLSNACSKTKPKNSHLNLYSSSSSDESMSSKSIKYKQPKKPPSDPPKPQQILIAKNKSLNTRPTIAARTKDSRLKGSDLYVIRLGSPNTAPSKPSLPHSATPTLSSPSPPSTPLRPTSLYDELSSLSRTSFPSIPAPQTKIEYSKPSIRASRPCYRCVTAMHSMGIKRVFWSNQDGEWEGAKVRELVDALEMGVGSGGEGGVGTGQESKGVFVTKHEVLMLKRMMGG